MMLWKTCIYFAILFVYLVQKCTITFCGWSFLKSKREKNLATFAFHSICITTNKHSQYNQLFIHFNIFTYLKGETNFLQPSNTHTTTQITPSQQWEKAFSCPGKIFLDSVNWKLFFDEVQCEFEYPTCIEKHFP